MPETRLFPTAASAMRRSCQELLTHMDTNVVKLDVSSVDGYAHNPLRAGGTISEA